MLKLKVFSGLLSAFLFFPAQASAQVNEARPFWEGAASGTSETEIEAGRGREQEGIVSAADISIYLTTTRNIVVEHRLALPAIQFEFGTARLTDTARRQLEQVAIALQHPSVSDLAVFIDGHTDASGPEDFNQRLSSQRAQAAVDYLVNTSGIDPARIEARGFGESRLLDFEDAESPLNRRVEISVRQ